MNDAKVNEVLDRYQWEVPATIAPDLPQDTIDQLTHAAGMIPRIREFVREGRREKAMRWLGFVQGVLWCVGRYTIDELKSHNAPDGPWAARDAEHASFLTFGGDDVAVVLHGVAFVDGVREPCQKFAERLAVALNADPLAR